MYALRGIFLRPSICLNPSPTVIRVTEQISFNVKQTGDKRTTGRTYSHSPASCGNGCERFRVSKISKTIISADHQKSLPTRQQAPQHSELRISQRFGEYVGDLSCRLEVCY